MTGYKDNFSNHSKTYVRFRPQYPANLFAYLRTLTVHADLAWDCGTGNGQSAISLANYFEKVIATDPSEQQIKHAVSHERVQYNVEPAEHSTLENNSVDLITIAQALHWFDFDKFYIEAKRVLKENGIIAAWAYGLPVISPAIDKAVKYFHDNIVGNFWQAENRLIDKEYTTIPFPFRELSSPDFTIQKELSLNELIGHIQSWSATQRFIVTNKYDPTIKLKDILSKLWGHHEHKKEIVWKLILKAGQHTFVNKAI